MEAKLQVRLLGPPEVHLDEAPLAAAMSGKGQAILYYLAVTGQPQPRSTLASLLWGETPEGAARTNLRKALAELRQVVGAHLVIDRQSVAFKPESDYWIDVTEFEAKVGDASPTMDTAQLQEGIELYRGEFLAGFYVRHAPDFEAWTLAEQVRLRELAVQALHTLADYHTTQGTLAQGIAYTRRLLSLEPWREEAHRDLMRLLARDGQRSAALAQYETCRQVLAEELGVEPGAETVALYERIRADEVSGGAGEPGSRGDIAVPPQPSVPHTPTPAHNLPPQPTPFIGREQELADITRRLQEPACRLLTLVGPGGSGKTRLALQAAQQLVDAQPTKDEFAYGIFFVPLQAVSTASEVVSAIAEAANFTFYSDVPPKQQLLDYLRQKRMLLVLDNFEHLLPSPPEWGTEGGTALIGEILAQAPGVKLLVTSREGLNLQQEWFHLIPGMPFPDDDETDSSVDDFDAVRFFTQSARRARVGFSLAAERVSVGRICRLVEGMPLALELAAAWLKVLPVEKIAQEIERGLDILTTRQQNVPERHRSMRAVLEQSWDLLSGDERDVLKGLSVFRGGFRQAGAEAVAGASLLTLATLVEKSLLRATATGRYQLHELLRQFAAEKLAAVTQQEVATRENHSAYYLAFLQARETRLTGKDQRQALDEIGEEIDNVRLAWDWAVEQHNIEAIAQALESLYHFYQIRSRYQEGQERFAYAASQLQQAAPVTEHLKFDLVLNMLSLRHGAFCLFLDDYEAAAQHLQVGLTSAGHQRELAFALRKLGEVASQQANRSLAEERLHQSLVISRGLGDLAGMAESLVGLAWAANNFGEHAQGKQLTSEGLVIWRQLGRPDQMARALTALAWSTGCLGAYHESEAYSQESLVICQEIGDSLGIAQSLSYLGWVAWCIGGTRLTEAIAFHDQALATFRELGYRQKISEALGDLALAAGELGNYARAIQYGHEGLAMAKEIDNVHFVVHNLYSLGAAACGLGDFQTGRNYLLDALEITWETLKSASLTTSLFYYAMLLLKESEFDDAPEANRFQQQVTALELLALVIRHPLTWQAIKDRSIRFQAQLEAELPADVVATAKVRGESRTLDEVVAEILQEAEAQRSQEAEEQGDRGAGEKISPLIPPYPHPPTRSQRRFVQEALIASGGMGEVYQGRDIETGRRVAIKRLKPELVAQNPEIVQRLIREGEALRQLNHPNIVKVLATSEAEGHPIIVMEYVPGGSLRELLADQPQLPLDRILDISLELADALARAHHLGILHRDLKPANVLLAEDGTPRLTDFGVAYLGGRETRLTQQGAILGTTAYMSPEAWRGEDLDVRSDIWSFGALLYEMLAGRPPFAKEQVTATLTAILNDPIPDLGQFRPDTPPALVGLIKHMLVKERELRIDSMRQVAAGLEVIRRGSAAFG